MKNKTTKIVLIITIILIISSIITIIASTTKQDTYLLEEKVLESYFIISDQGGIGVIPGVVFFGKMMPGGSGTAKIEINNNYNKEVIAKITASEEIEPYFVEQKIVISPKEKKEVLLTVKIPKEAKNGEYKGKVIIKIVTII
ncbi:MAG: hypothetical protein AABW73_00945 [Nanoarchaeota archaeon]